MREEDQRLIIGFSSGKPCIAETVCVSWRHLAIQGIMHCVGPVRQNQFCFGIVRFRIFWCSALIWGLCYFTEMIFLLRLNIVRLDRIKRIIAVITSVIASQITCVSKIAVYYPLSHFCFGLKYSSIPTSKWEIPFAPLSSDLWTFGRSAVFNHNDVD